MITINLKKKWLNLLIAIIIAGGIALSLFIQPAAANFVEIEELCYESGGDIFLGGDLYNSPGGYLARPINFVGALACGKICWDGSIVWATFIPDHGIDDIFIFPACPDGPGVRPDAPSDDVNAGGNLDISYGSCGAYISNSPVDGTVGLTRANRGTAQPPFGVNFLRNGCKASFTSDTGYSGDGTLVTIYFQLNMSEYQMWLDGELTIYFGDAGNWTECPNPFWIDDGSTYGRLACTSSGFNTYFLGTK